MIMRGRVWRWGAVMVFVAASFVGCGDDEKGGEPAAEPVIVRGAGADAAAIAGFVQQYRDVLGDDNGGEPGTRGTSGYRELNWDSLPDEVCAPNACPSDIFNAPTAPRARGIVLHTSGQALMVSADSDNPTGTAPRFGNLNAHYPDAFKTYSPERLFSPVGSNLVEITFFVPGSSTPATVRGFGAVYCDVDTHHTAFEYFDRNGNSLGEFETPISNNGLSFLGVVFDEPIVYRVEVRYGTSVLGPDDGQDTDVAVMDNFIFAEPQPIP
ncbi:MAG: hypothetical protein KC729_08365 [Candidatus Eisenbacteria bacterium]|uniref:Uncharacterized protein n=1 Tax=Eiseniibacteriota bacterium TaxID=2212470 RepID=A0A956LYR6_UNCEI|nr:hypothetical protein [Candidatus Eisenbacteria bacterium]